MRIAPVFSTMKSRAVSPGGAVMYSGVLSPEATSTKPTLAGPDGSGGLLAAGSEHPQNRMVETPKTNVG